jgi:hypothetical protein
MKLGTESWEVSRNAPFNAAPGSLTSEIDVPVAPLGSMDELLGGALAIASGKATAARTQLASSAC